METKVGHELIRHKREVIQGFKDAFDLLQDLEKHPEKIEKLPKKGILVKTKKRRMIIPTNGNNRTFVL